MILQVFALRDVKADTFGRPVFVAALGSLIRDIQSVVQAAGDDLIAKHPRDFVLYRLGTFDDSKGTFDLLPLPDLVLEVASLVVPAVPMSVPADAFSGVVN